MGYETKAFIVEMHSLGGVPRTGSVIAMVELCKCGNGHFAAIRDEYIKKAKSEDRVPFALWTFTQNGYSDDIVKALKFCVEHGGNTVLLDGDNEADVPYLDQEEADLATSEYVQTDRYGDPIPFIPIGEVYEAVQKDIEEMIRKDGFAYRRYVIFAATLKTVMDTFSDHTRLGVACFGH